MFSIGLGVAELWAPQQVARLVGARAGKRTQTLIRAAGVREVLVGLGLLVASRPSGWLWARVGGDLVDLAMLRGARACRRSGHLGNTVATAAVAGVTLLDAGSAVQQRERRRAAPARRKRGIRVTRTVIINRPRGEVYRFWRRLENLPRFMAHLDEVHVRDGRSHWRAKGPAGTHVEWDAEITEDRPDDLIAWRSLPGARVPNQGTVRFLDAPGGRGTLVRVSLRYDPPTGAIGAAFAKLFGEEPAQQVKGDLRRLKQVLEIGEVVHSDASIHRGMHPARPSPEGPRLVGRA